MRGANDTVNAPSGNDTIVIEARGDVVHAHAGDHLVFERLNASPPAHPDTIEHLRHGDKIDLLDLHFFVLSQQHLVFIGAQTFAHYHHLHPTVFGMVRDSGGVVQVNVDHHLKAEFAINVPGAPALHASDFIL